ncbi:MerR family DNA-binding transcriptional regulator [Niallia sp. 01092]|uniref:MerR family DNA-binding transcriptional regulator n=1 Tax=unclassified Niallia TaxID=2837522 RepID=UPI003FD2693F
MGVIEGTNKPYLIGELATTGVTVRTLLHYDKIGLLPTSGRTDGNVIILKKLCFVASQTYIKQSVKHYLASQSISNLNISL